eukprot:338834-Pyramimonas_sp.AAC.1
MALEGVLADFEPLPCDEGVGVGDRQHEGGHMQISGLDHWEELELEDVAAPAAAAVPAEEHQGPRHPRRSAGH